MGKQMNSDSIVNFGASGKTQIHGSGLPFKAPQVKLGDESMRRFAESGHSQGKKIPRVKPDPRLQGPPSQ